MNDVHAHHDGHAPGESWDEKATWYAQLADLLEPEQRHATEALLDAVGAGPGKRILDLACGPGHCTVAADARGAVSLGVDRSPAMIAEAKRRFATSRFQLGDMMQPPLGPWDGIVCRFGAHHADPSWLTAARKVLWPGGRLAVAEFPPEDAADSERGMIDPEEWRVRFATAGLTEIKISSLTLHIDRLIAKNPKLKRLVREGQDASRMRLHDRVVWIISGSKPTDA